MKWCILCNLFRLMHYKSLQAKYLQNRSASQARDGGSIPLARFFISLRCRDLYNRPSFREGFFGFMRVTAVSSRKPSCLVIINQQKSTKSGELSYAPSQRYRFDDPSIITNPNTKIFVLYCIQMGYASILRIWHFY